MQTRTAQLLPVGLLVLCAFALGHGERSTTNPNAGGGAPAIGIPRDGSGDGSGGNSSGPSTPRSAHGAHDWRLWWAYNREWILAARMRGRPVTGIERDTNQEVVTRKRLRETKMYELMQGALRDKNQRVRAAAAVALGKFGLSDADTALGRRTSTPPSKWYTVRQASIFGLAALGDPDRRGTFQRITGDKERPITDRSLALLGFLLDGTEPSSDEIRARTKFFRSGVKTASDALPINDEQERRRFAAHLLGFSKYEHDELLHSMARGSRKWGPGEQGLAITALGRRGNPEYVDALFRIFYRRDEDDQVKRSVAIALGRMLPPSHESGIRQLGRLVRDAKRDPITQHFGVMSLGRIGGKHAREVLLSMERNKTLNTQEDRAFMYLALGLCGAGSKDIMHLLALRFQRASTVSERGALAVACGLAGAREVIPALLNRLDKTSLRGNRAAAGARKGAPAYSGGFLPWGVLSLGMLGDTAQVSRVRAIFKKYSHARVRENAAIALALLQGRASVRGLVDVLKNAGTMHTKAAIVTALGILPDPSMKAIEALIDVYRDDSQNDQVRAMAIIALGAMVDPRPVPLSVMLTRDYNYFIRSHAIDWLAALL